MYTVVEMVVIVCLKALLIFGLMPCGFTSVLISRVSVRTLLTSFSINDAVEAKGIGGSSKSAE